MGTQSNAAAHNCHKHGDQHGKMTNQTEQGGPRTCSSVAVVPADGEQAAENAQQRALHGASLAGALCVWRTKQNERPCRTEAHIGDNS
jgi:hypothetical protein